MSAPVSTRTVGPYRLIAQIGEGGMGVVYLADAPNGSRVAVKVLRPGVVGDAHGRSRLAREVTSLRRVRSPRIAEVYDADPWGETPYVVTRFVAGPSLREVVDSRGSLTGADLHRVAGGLAEALVVVHRADVLHRDVKPSNVLLEAGDPVLIDFGLAQLSDDMTLTQAGWLLGTPGYLAPEILYGEGPTPAADVHAWAATVVFAATGSGPYGSGPAMAVMDRARRGEFDLSVVPSPMVPVLTAALRMDPANRPTARQVVEWLGVSARGIVPAPAPTVIPRQPPAVAPQPAPAIAPRQTPPSPAQAPVVPFRAAPVGSTALTPLVDAYPGRLRRVVLWLCVSFLLLAGVVAAPVVAVVWAVLLGWALRTLAVATSSVREWRQSRGPRRRDTMLCVLALPWFAARRLVASLVNAACLLAVAGGFVALGRFGPAVGERPALVVAGLVVAAVSWWGPLTRDVRRGAAHVTSRLPRSGLALAVVLVLLLGVACGLLALQQVVGTSYLPLSSR